MEVENNKNIDIKEKTNNFEENIKSEYMVNDDKSQENKSSKTQTIISLLKSLKISYGMDVSSAPVPGTLISPFSSLTYFYDNFAGNFEILINARKIKNDKQRILEVYKYLNTIFIINNELFSKPLNPIIGETNSSQFKVKDSMGNEINDNYYMVEHIQQNPPLSLACIYNKKEGIKVNFHHGIKIIFCGTYFKVGFEGAEFNIEFENYDEIYTIEIPPLITRFLRGFSEYSGQGKITSNKSKYFIEVNYNSKPLFGGKYNYCEGYLKDSETEKPQLKIFGCWDDELKATDLSLNSTHSFFKKPKGRYEKIESKHSSLDTDSSNIWKGVIDAHNEKNYKLKVKEKNKVEEEQNKLEIERKNNNIEWVPQHFVKSLITNKWELKNFK